MLLFSSCGGNYPGLQLPWCWWSILDQLVSRGGATFYTASCRHVRDRVASAAWQLLMAAVAIRYLRFRSSDELSPVRLGDTPMSKSLI